MFLNISETDQGQKKKQNKKQKTKNQGLAGHNWLVGCHLRTPGVHFHLQLLTKKHIIFVRRRKKVSEKAC